MPKGRTRITRKHQVTLPVAALRESGLRPGDDVAVYSDGTGRVVVERIEDLIARTADALRGTWPRGALAELEDLRDEWR